jgi:hypothetical protein
MGVLERPAEVRQMLESQQFFFEKKNKARRLERLHEGKA